MLLVYQLVLSLLVYKIVLWRCISVNQLVLKFIRCLLVHQLALRNISVMRRLLVFQLVLRCISVNLQMSIGLSISFMIYNR